MSGVFQIAGGVAAQEQGVVDGAFRRQLGAIEASDHRRETRRLLARQQVAFAAAGVDPTLGTPLDVLADSVRERELAALRIRFARETEAKQLISRGKQAFVEGAVGGTASLASSVASFGVFEGLGGG